MGIAVCDYEQELVQCGKPAIWQISLPVKPFEKGQHSLHSCATHIGQVLPKGRREYLKVVWIGEFSGSDNITT